VVEAERVDLVVVAGDIYDRALPHVDAVRLADETLARLAASRAQVVLTSGNELKLVFPQLDAMPDRFESLAFEQFFLQPMDGPVVAENTVKAVAYCLAHPRWRLSLQTHKLLGIP
jgi:organic radical activating enzyme